jgi:uncharacterized protein (TIGR02453 family)
MPDPAAAPPFTGFVPAAFAWFSGLEADNSRAWFSAQRAVYDQEVRGPLSALLEELAEEHGGRVRLARQHRDIRFSADKSPYKTRAYGLYGLIVDRPDSVASLYLELSSAGLFAGSGYHGFAADQLARFRDAVAGEPAGPALEQTLDAVEAAGIETFGQALKTAPRGFPRDHPRAALLRHKSLIAGRRLIPSAEGAITAAAASDHARSTWSAIAPMNAWLDAHVGATAHPAHR